MKRAMTVHYGSGESDGVIRATLAAARLKRGANKRRREGAAPRLCSKERQGQR